MTSKLLPLVLALGWLPASILLRALLHQQIPPPMAWLSLWPTALAGLPLAGAIWQLQRLGYSRVACWLMVLLGAATIPVALVAGVLGAVAIVVAAGVVSLPAWLVVLLLWWRARGNAQSPVDCQTWGKRPARRARHTGWWR